MTDKELLELAAKAVGIERLNFDRERRDWSWNPIDDDGDALRLAVKLGMKEYFGGEITKSYAQADAFQPWEHCEHEEYNEAQGPYAATRRAIVRAAAEIGKEMK